jgi:hypothetical protein
LHCKQQCRAANQHGQHSLQCMQHCRQIGIHIVQALVQLLTSDSLILAFLLLFLLSLRYKIHAGAATAAISRCQAASALYHEVPEVT